MQRIKDILWMRRTDVLTVLIIILVAGAAFGIGRLSVIYDHGSDFRITTTP